MLSSCTAALDLTCTAALDLTLFLSCFWFCDAACLSHLLLVTQAVTRLFITDETHRKHWLHQFFLMLSLM